MSREDADGVKDLSTLRPLPSLCGVSLRELLLRAPECRDGNAFGMEEQ